MGTWIIKVAAVAVVVILAACVFFAWRDARKEQAALQAELKTTQQALAEATARQASRDVAVNDLVAGLKKKEAAVQKPVQALAALPDVLPLPEAITLHAGPVVNPAGASGAAENRAPASLPPSGQAEGGRYSGKSPDIVDFPVADLKPLYDFAVECKACQAKLGAAQADLVDEKAKSLALGRERDDALRVAKGGSVLRRIARAAKWFAIGAAAGAIAAKAARL
jgi:hypothetical protein